jgi:hypothetical protein
MQSKERNSSVHLESSSVLNPTEQLILLADKHEMSAEGQLDLIKSFGDCPNVDEFHKLAEIIDEELTRAAAPLPDPPAAPEPAPAVMTAGSGAAEISAFFDRDLARHSLKRLVQLPSDGVVFERNGYDTARVVVPKTEFATYQETLVRGMDFQDGHPPHGEIVAGWYHVFADGSTAAIAIVNAATGDGGAFVDAFLIIQEGVHPTVPNPSLQARRRLDEDFVFPYPDGTYRVLRLVPSTV